ncbi:MAG: hypothetical protein Q9169_005494 [Polycauliona sp. 2 TL-2023]
MTKPLQATLSPLARITRSLRSHVPNVKSRTDIVSSQLCDDALARLATSLQQYKGCTIIDINPGIGLWSSKIHEIVKPRQHILAEPPSSPFRSQLKPLIEQTSSRYKLVDYDNVEAWEPDRYVAEGLLPPLDLQKSTEPNRSILFLANTAYAAPRSHTSPIARAHVKLLHWASDIANRATFHAGGPVRMLVWCPEKEATSILPRTLRHRSKLSLMLEMTCHIEEIVASDELISAKQKKRDPITELESGKRVATLMEESGDVVPPGRETSLHKQIREALDRSKSEGNKGTDDSTPTRTRGWHEELEYLRRKFKDMPKDSKGRFIIKGQPKEILEDTKFRRFLELERNSRHYQKVSGVIEGLLQEQAEIDALDLQAYDPKLKDESQRTATLATIQQKKQQLRKRLDDLKNPANRDEFKFFKHDRKAFSSNPPLLMWDHRRAEPLKSYKEEFYPQKNLCLLDVQPRSPLPYPLTSTQIMYLRMLTTALWHNGSDRLTVLDRIAPGAFDAVVSNVPALTDPARGGERDILDLPINRLTPEMAHGLTKAWLDWPFRPHLGDLILKGSFVDDDAGEDSAIPGGR